MAKPANNEEPASPAWLKEGQEPEVDVEEDDDDEEEDENTPLFGTGPLSLQDSDEQEDNNAPAVTYGTVPDDEENTGEAEGKDPKVPKLDEEWHQEKSKKKKKGKSKKKPGEARVPRKNCCLHFFTFVEMVAIIACLGLLSTQVLPLFLVSLDDIGILQLALRAYVSLFCLIFILVELDVQLGFIQNSAFFQNYFTRGFIYSFVGLIGMEEAYEVIVTHLTKGDDGDKHAFDEFHIEWAPLFIKATSWLMVVIGCVYMVLGIFFMKHLRDGLRRNYYRAVDRYRQEAENAV